MATIDKAVVAKPVQVSPHLKTWAMRGFMAIAGILTLSYLASPARTPHPGQQPGVEVPTAMAVVASEKMPGGGVLLMTPFGDSPRVQVPVGYAVHIDGDGFELHCVYDNGVDSTACPDGPIEYAYVTDTKGDDNRVQYEFVRTKRISG